MKLKRVVYELYEVDFVSLEGEADSDFHEIDREIFLEFESGEKIYFSWCSEPVQYCIGFRPERFNANEPDHAVDTTSWKIWRNLIGQDISFVFIDDSHQVLELKGQSSSTYLSSQERGSWVADVLHVSKGLPVVGN
ncbi:hypothetical protein L3V43_06990 [Pseudoalteromonas sp. L23]|uniref:hypothetical protein n=1 Tax=unclassified Pseudoalteromonas TaxID=194690 RepID=UPI001EF09D61|nr:MULTISPECIES: hypothetical protein [unclassified Pseudoalteromonas]MCF7513630.1 hypothetical protein [Pseudoalteromonas sp. L7]MCF7525393.1 hypothetical protein [Pseudoalteromonas sp. L23]MCX2766094.1 hypothetical protein [Pseudoalteromonas sp. B530]